MLLKDAAAAPRPEIAFPAVKPPVDPAAMIESTQRALDAAFDAQTHFLERWRALSEETRRFMDRRLEADREAARALLSCGSPAEALSVCSSVMHRAATHYGEEMQRLSALFARHAQETMADVNHQFYETFETAKPGGAPSERGAGQAPG